MSKDSNRLSKILAAAGVSSRRKAEELIASGQIKVNGEVVLTPQTHVDPYVDRIEVEGKQLEKPERKVYYLLHKPAGYYCSAAEQYKGKRVIDLFVEVPSRLFTVGRLDKETSGLLIITNDGHFAQEVIHPSAGITKEYLAKVHREVKLEDLKKMTEGSFVEGTFVKPKKVVKVRRNTLKITVSEGKKHEVRKILESAGLTTLQLKRIRIGGLQIGKLAEGEWREMTLNDRLQAAGKG